MFVTATFVATEEAKPNALPISPSKCFKAFEQFYVRLLSELMRHYNRPGLRHLQPLTYAFIDYPAPSERRAGRYRILRSCCGDSVVNTPR